MSDMNMDDLWQRLNDRALAKRGPQAKASPYRPPKRIFRRRFTDDEIRLIRKRHLDGETLWTIAKTYGCWDSTICQICLRRMYRRVE
jgi:hypothetical protein